MPVVPIDFILFGLTLLGVALFHQRTLEIAVTGLAAIIAYKLLFNQFPDGSGWPGLVSHLRHEWVTLANLAALLLGFGLLSAHFEQSGIPKVLPKFLPADWRGPLVMLAMVFVLSSFLDNIAAALIGGTMAHALFPRVHIGYIAAIVAASNAGGSGSVVGDTTTTMMWIDGVAPGDVVHAYVAAATALFVCGIPASIQQHRHSPMAPVSVDATVVDWTRVFIVVLILGAAVAVNVTVNVEYPEYADAFPFLGVAVWAAILAAAPLRRPDWHAFQSGLKGTAFLLSLVLAASLMPVEQLPHPSWQTTLGLGFVSAVFDNIPLTALALSQGGYDWGMLAYAVGFGGSMIWFGSSAGVAITNVFPKARSVGSWLRHGWHVAVAYVLGFFVLLGVLGWQPQAKAGEGALLPDRSPGRPVAGAVRADRPDHRQFPICGRISPFSGSRDQRRTDCGRAVVAKTGRAAGYCCQTECGGQRCTGMPGLAASASPCRSLFARLAFDDAALLDSAKIGILAASLFAGLIAAFLLRVGPGRSPRME